MMEVEVSFGVLVNGVRSFLRRGQSPGSRNAGHFQLRWILSGSALITLGVHSPVFI